MPIYMDRHVGALKLYIELESLRFDKKLDYEIQCDQDADTDFIQIPPMLLPPFAENAIWHGLMHKETKGNLWIKIWQEEATLLCMITDDGIGREKAADLKTQPAFVHKSMGMGITADRIALLKQHKQTEASIVITDLVLPDGGAAGTEVLIKIPISYD